MTETEPVAWTYELASHINVETGEYEGWYRYVTFTKPEVPKASIKKLVPLYAKENENAK